MVKPLFVGNWKMHHSPPETIQYLNTWRQFSLPKEAEVVFCPPFTSLSLFPQADGEGPLLGVQNLHSEDKGAYTGEISAGFLGHWGVRYALLGHSERRQYFSETDEQVARKVQAALRHQITPILCVGEDRAQREAGQWPEVIREQLIGGLALAGQQVGQCCVAYEPVWAIGTGLTPTPEEIVEVMRFLRQLLAERYGEQGSRTRLLYGGSVTPQNITMLMKLPHVHGVLVGGASLVPETFYQLVVEGEQAWKQKGEQS